MQQKSYSKEFKLSYRKVCLTQNSLTRFYISSSSWISMEMQTKILNLLLQSKRSNKYLLRDLKKSSHRYSLQNQLSKKFNKNLLIQDYNRNHNNLYILQSQLPNQTDLKTIITILLSKHQNHSLLLQVDRLFNQNLLLPCNNKNL